MQNIITSTEFFNQIANIIAMEVVRYTPQLYAVKNHNSKLPPSLDSSAILITVEQRFFLITTGHSVHETDINHVGLMIGNDFATIGGLLKYYQPNSENYYEPNNVDIAVFELDDSTVTMLKIKYDFLQWNKVVHEQFAYRNIRCLVFGYPEENTVKNQPTKTITPSPFILRTIGVPYEYYLEEKIDVRNIFALSFDIVESQHQVKHTQDLGGISGCGVWEIFDLYEQVPKYRLVSILTGQNEYQTVLYSTKMNVIKTILKMQFQVNV